MARLLKPHWFSIIHHHQKKKEEEDDDDEYVFHPCDLV